MKPLSVHFDTEKELYFNYMPFLKNGGIFVRTTAEFEIGDQVDLQLTLPDALEATEVKGQVCWLTPIGVQNGTPPGVGVSFIEDKENAKIQIEKLLGHLLSSNEPTNTM